MGLYSWFLSIIAHCFPVLFFYISDANSPPQLYSHHRESVPPSSYKSVKTFKKNKIHRFLYQLHFIGHISPVMVKGNLTIMELGSWAERALTPHYSYYSITDPIGRDRPCRWILLYYSSRKKKAFPYLMPHRQPSQ